MNGFLRTGATFRADLNLIIQIGMGVALLVGMLLARRKQFRAHKYCQSSVMVLNLAMIFLIMAPSFHKQVQPKVPAGLNQGYYLVPYVHALLGTVAEALGIYIVLVAATKLIPRKLRFKRYKRWMRTELVLWWLVVFIGIGTYYAWYIRSDERPGAVITAVPAPAEGKIRVKLSNFQFDPKEITVKAGSTIEWTDEGGRHTVEADDGSFKSDTMTAGGTFEHKFDAPGIFPYYCTLHGDKHGVDMSGVVTVTPSGQ